MEVFMIDTDAVSSAKGSIDSMASQVLSLASTVNGYDTSCEDGFDFAGAKGVIARNIEAAGTKFQSTGKLMDSVVSSHTQLQNQLKFDGTKSDDNNPADNNPADKNPADKNPADDNTDNRSYSPRSSSPDYSYSPTPDTPVEIPTVTPEVGTEVTEKIEKVEHIKFNLESLSDDLKGILSFNTLGLLTFEGMFVIACSSAFGKVGDVLEVTLKDGNKVKCFIGSHIENSNGQIRFFVNDKYQEGASGDITTNFAGNVDKIYNNGSFTSPTKPSTPAASTSPSTGTAATVTTPLGEHTGTISTLQGEWVVPTVKTDITGYASYAAGKISQNADSSRFGDKCLSFAETHAYALYTGNTGDSAERAANYPHSGAFTSWYSDSEQETLSKIYSEISAGKPVVVQVNGNKKGTSRHFVTVVGFNKNVASSGQLTQKDLLIMDSWDGKIERMDQANSRFFTTGKDCGKTYSGYYLRVLKS